MVQGLARIYGSQMGQGSSGPFSTVACWRKSKGVALSKAWKQAKTGWYPGNAKLESTVKG